MNAYKWKKKGLIIRPDQLGPWVKSHAQAATPLQITSSIYRIFCAPRDFDQRPHICYADIDLNTLKIIDIAKQPILSPGAIGNFDEHGVYPSSIVKEGNRLFLYYIGYTRGSPSPLWYGAIGLAVSEDGGDTFRRHSAAPILSRSDHDPCFTTAPCVLRNDDGWRMYYVSGMRWERIQNSLRSYYHIKLAVSQNGINWEQTGKVALDFKDPSETNIGRTCIVHDDNLYQAWYPYSSLHKPYRIGYAESHDGFAWIRKDEAAGIMPSADSFDSEMLCYPFIIQHHCKKYMFYNGNQFGRDGLAIAIAE